MSKIKDNWIIITLAIIVFLWNGGVSALYAKSVFQQVVFEAKTISWLLVLMMFKR